MLKQNQIEKIDKFIEQKESKTSIGEIEDNLEKLGLDVKIGEWLKNDKKLLAYAELFLNPDKGVFDNIKLQFLELKASITCPYFADFKDFLNELKKGEEQEDNNSQEQKTGQDNIEYMGQGHDFLGIDVSQIKSHPFYKSAKTGSTWCAATARFNALDFGLHLPSGNAYDAGAKIPQIPEYKTTIPASKKLDRPDSSRSAISISRFKSIDDNINFADIYLNSKSDYGHRAVAFKDSTGQWFVLDPYTKVNGRLDNKPKKIEDYVLHRKILKANFYRSPGYKFESRNYA